MCGRWKQYENFETAEEAKANVPGKAEVAVPSDRTGDVDRTHEANEDVNNLKLKAKSCSGLEIVNSSGPPRGQKGGGGDIQHPSGAPRATTWSLGWGQPLLFLF